MVRLGDVVDDLRSGFACGIDDPEGIVQFRMNNVERDGALNWTKTRRVPVKMLKKGLSLQPNDILLNATNSPDLVGKTALFVGADEPVTFSNHFLRLRIRAQAAEPSYVARWLRRQFELGSFKAMCRSWVNQASITRDQVSNLEIPLPPLDEQKRIAAILDKADQLRQKRRQAIALLESLTQSIFLEMFGEERSSGWPTATVGEVALDIRTGPFGSQLLHSEFVDEGIAVLGIDNAVNNRFEWGKPRYISPKKYSDLARYTVRPGDVLITIMGTCGRCAIVPDDIPTSINTKHLCCITLDKRNIIPEYLHGCLLNAPSVLRQLGVQAKGAVMPGLNMGIVKSLSIPIPPLELQKRFRATLEAALDRRRLLLIAAFADETLFSSLQHRAFTGQL
ncbi:restriction endonuclease subunit S [Labrys monachus]|uniref:Type I restriction enzyme S subunit n=1 Tax=Labrys monachus TaxID=217067 RepID=A0ABU0F7U5_9HYPH|nr:restriction endonuclease subunit S [Labrys monachus]MDQ0390683.1 type I restriction enzyme S subunit [Labrys monachus]